MYSAMAYVKVLAELFAVRGHDLKKWLFFRFAEGVRPYKPPFAGLGSCRTAGFWSLARFESRRNYELILKRLERGSWQDGG